MHLKWEFKIYNCTHRIRQSPEIHSVLLIGHNLLQVDDVLVEADFLCDESACYTNSWTNIILTKHSYLEYVILFIILFYKLITFKLIE